MVALGLALRTFCRNFTSCSHCWTLRCSCTSHTEQVLPPFLRPDIDRRTSFARPEASFCEWGDRPIAALGHRATAHRAVIGGLVGHDIGEVAAHVDDHVVVPLEDQLGVWACRGGRGRWPTEGQAGFLWCADPAVYGSWYRAKNGRKAPDPGPT